MGLGRCKGVGVARAAGHHPALRRALGRMCVAGAAAEMVIRFGFADGAVRLGADALEDVERDDDQHQRDKQHYADLHHVLFDLQ